MISHQKTWHGEVHTHSIPPVVLLPWLSSMSSHGSHLGSYLMASMGYDIYPSIKCTWSCGHPCPLHITWSLHLSFVDASVNIHGRSHNFPSIHPREVFLAWCWLIARPLSYHGIVSLSLPLGVGLTEVGMVHLFHTWCDTHTQGNASFWCDKEESVALKDVWLSTLVHHFIWGDICHDWTHHLMGLVLPPVFNLPLSLEGVSLD